MTAKVTTRRNFLKLLGVGAVAAAAPALIVEPARKMWFVGSSAPVGSRIETLGGDHLDALNYMYSSGGKPALSARLARTWSMKLQISEEALADAKYPEMISRARECKRALHRELERDLAKVHGIMIDELVPFTAEDYAELRKPRPIVDFSNVSITPDPKSEHYWLASKYRAALAALDPPVQSALLHGKWYVKG